jgi:hypothetical protein
MNFTACPKCGHTPLPAEQAAPAACPACGLILAKFGAAPARQRPAAIDAPLSPDGGGTPERSHITALLLHVPDAVSKLNWQGRIAALLLFCLWTLWIWHGTDIPAGEIGSTFLHMILLPFHEAGHYAIFRWFGEFIMILGGTLGQHLMPIVLGVSLLVKRRDPFGAALFFWLLGFSVMDMGIYMYDAYDPKLQLLGGGTGAEQDGHDWQNIFGDLNLLKRARGIGIFFGVVGRAMMLLGLAWAAWIIWLQKARLSDSPLAEEDYSDPV